MTGDEWLGFECIRVFEAERDGIDLRLVPLVGYTRGQVGVAIETEGGPLLHYADSYFWHSEMEEAHPTEHLDSSSCSGTCK